MDQETFKQTVFYLKDEMFRFAKSLLVSHDAAQDTVQDLMLKFWQKKDELPKSSLKSYVLKAVKNECLNRLRHETVKESFAEVSKRNDGHCTVEINNLNEEILKFIAMLPEKQCAVMHLKDVEEYDVSEISEILGLEENAIRTNLMRARQKVRQQITQLMNYENRSISG